MVNENMQAKLKDFINKKRNQLPEYFEDTLYYWVGGRVDVSGGGNQWEWVSHYQAFEDYTKWNGNEDSTYNSTCPS